jgi:hypothetical protein
VAPPAAAAPAQNPYTITRQIYFDIEQGGVDVGRVVIGL